MYKYYKPVVKTKSGIKIKNDMQEKYITIKTAAIRQNY
jgi:hypothetical protein